MLSASVSGPVLAFPRPAPLEHPLLHGLCFSGPVSRSVSHDRLCLIFVDQTSSRDFIIRICLSPGLAASQTTPPPSSRRTLRSCHPHLQAAELKTDKKKLLESKFHHHSCYAYVSPHVACVRMARHWQSDRTEHPINLDLDATPALLPLTSHKKGSAITNPTFLRLPACRPHTASSRVAG